MSERDPNATVQVNLRIKERERRLLLEAATRNHTTLNGEMAARVMRSFEQDHLATLRHWANDQEAVLLSLFGNIDELRQQEALIRASESLMARIQPLLDSKVVGERLSEGIKQDIAAIRSAIRTVEFMWSRRRPGASASKGSE